MQAPNPKKQSDEELNVLVGKTLGHFRIVERIGSGGMATVFKAFQPTLERYVAIKVLPSHYAREPNFVKRFVQEARVVAKLVHPNILQIHDFGEQDNITYIVMEYVEGGTLKERLARPLSTSDAADYIIQAAEGLSCAHANGIIHRDVKPANMLLRKDGFLLLSDFGIAKILEGTANLTRAGVGIGTPQYMSPEQGTGATVDPRSDIYSLGIVLFHCLAGQVPFTGDTPLSITLKHLNEPLPIEMLRAKNIPAPIEQVILKMTAKRAEDRYQTTNALIEALIASLTASQIALPQRWRPGSSSPMPKLDTPASNSGTLLPGMSNQPVQRLPTPSYPQPQPFFHPIQPPVVTIPCFRCGASNPSTRLFCTTCGYELADRRAAADRFLGPNGRPVLARLTIRDGAMTSRSYRFHQDVTTIGRTSGNDLVIAGRTVSRRHARLWFDSGRWILEDLQSANGTRVNNTLINQPIVLKDGDIVSFGDEMVVFNMTY